MSGAHPTGSPRSQVDERTISSRLGPPGLLALARLGLGAGPAPGRSRAGRRRPRAELHDPVAERRGPLELQVLGGRSISASSSARYSSVMSVASSRPTALRASAWAWISSSIPRRIALTIVSGVMPCSALYASCSVAAAVGLVDRPLHRLGHLVGVQDHLGVHVAGRPADRLDQRRLAPQEAFLVGVEDADQRHLRQVEPLAQQVHADQHVERPFAQLAEDGRRARWRRARECSHLHAQALLLEVAATGPRPAAW